MKYIIAIVIFFGLSFGNTAIAEERKDVFGYYKHNWRDSIEASRNICGPYFIVITEGESYTCNRIREFQGIDFSRGFGITQKTGLFRPPIKNTIFRYTKTLLYEIDIVFEGKQDANMLKAEANLQSAYKDFFNILEAEFGPPKKSIKKGEMSLYRRMDIWSSPSGCIMLQIIGERWEGQVTLKHKEKCGTI